MYVSSSILLLGVSAIIFSCGQNTSTKDKTTLTEDSCSFDKYLRDPGTPGLAVRIFNGEKWSLNDEHVDDYIDSLDKNYNKESGLFYFKVVAESYKKADGAYAEELGVFGKEFVEKHTKTFTHYFENKKCLSVRELESWADIVMLEISLLASEPEDSLLRSSGRPVNNYVNELNKNCESCTQDQKATLHKFATLLNQKWLDYVKLVDESSR